VKGSPEISTSIFYSEKEGRAFLPNFDNFFTGYMTSRDRAQ